MKTILLILAIICAPLMVDAQYTLKGKIVPFLELGAGSFVDGALNRHEFQSRTTFERKWNVNPHGFWGSKSYLSVYKQGNPELGFKSSFHEWAGAIDGVHAMDDFRKWTYWDSGRRLGRAQAKYNKKPIHDWIDFGFTVLISSVYKSAGDYWAAGRGPFR